MRLPATLVRSASIVLVLVTWGACEIRAEEDARYIHPDDKTGASSAVVVGDWPLVHTTQILPTDAEGAVATAGAEAQMEKVLSNLETLLPAAGSKLERVVKLNVYLAQQEFAADAQRVLARRFPGQKKPAVSLVVTRLPQSGVLIAADAVATTTLASGDTVMLAGQGVDAAPDPAKTPDKAPSASLAVAPGGTRIYIAGQAERSESLATATRNTLESLRNTLRFLGRSDADVVQLKAFLTPMSDADIVRQEVAAFFANRPAPPLVLVEWNSAANLPIEIEMIAWGGKDGQGDAVEYLTPPGMTTSPIYSRVARVNRAPMIYVSGLYASPGAERSADANTPAAGEREVKEVFSRLEEILQQAGSDLRHLVKATYYVSTSAASAKLNELRPRYYDPQRPPSASKAAVSGVGRAGLGLTLDMIAVPASGAER